MGIPESCGCSESVELGGIRKVYVTPFLDMAKVVKRLCYKCVSRWF